MPRSTGICLAIAFLSVFLNLDLNLIQLNNLSDGLPGVYPSFNFGKFLSHISGKGCANGIPIDLITYQPNSLLLHLDLANLYATCSARGPSLVRLGAKPDYAELASGVG